MEIVIKIDEELYMEYVNIQLCRGNGKTITDNLLKAIKNGKPLPEHHGDLKDEREVANILLKYAHSEQGKRFAYFLVSEIKSAPTIIEADKGE